MVVTESGSGYTATPVVRFSGGGLGATAKAYMGAVAVGPPMIGSDSGKLARPAVRMGLAEPLGAGVEVIAPCGARLCFTGPTRRSSCGASSASMPTTGSANSGLAGAMWCNASEHDGHGSPGRR